MNGFNFTERVRRVLALAREESARLHHEYVGTEHLLLGLVREGEGTGIQVLRELGIDREALVRQVNQIVQKGRATTIPGPDLPYTSRAKTVLELSMREAQNFNHPYVGTEHLLLGIVAEGKGIAAQVLVQAGLTLDAARAEVARLLVADVPLPRPPLDDEELHLVRGKPVQRVEVVLHYPDGRHFRGTFESPRDAATFLEMMGRG